MTESRIVTNSEEETIALGERLGRTLRAGDVVSLEGELGAGKTRLVQGIARGLGLSTARVNSPTFVLVNMYAGLKDGGALVHVDAYRLGGAEELPALGWDRLTDGSNIVVIEWASRIEAALPRDRIEVGIEHAGAERRAFALRLPADRAMPEAACRVCGGPVRGAGAFCSERCRMADLGRWFGGEYRISRPLTERDLE